MDNDWEILEKTNLNSFRKSQKIIILQNEQITKQLLYIREELAKVKKQVKKLTNLYQVTQIFSQIPQIPQIPQDDLVNNESNESNENDGDNKVMNYI